eukprot:27044_1
MIFNTFIMKLIIICIMLITMTDSMSKNNRRKRKLNMKKYNRVLDSKSSIKPTANTQIFTADVNVNVDVIYFDKNCADQLQNDGGVKHIRDELMRDIKECFEINTHNPEINDRNDFDYFIFLTLKTQKSDCVQKKTNLIVDLEAYCISMIENEPIFKKDTIIRQTNPQPWNLETIEDAIGINNYDGYHYDDFQHNNLAVYILDEKVQLDHPEFSNIITKQYIGDNGGIWNPDDHGTHVAGTMIGKSVGIIRDVSVPLYSYGVCSNGLYCYWSDITAGFNALIAHLLANPGRRAVINYSVGGGASSRYDTFLRDIRNAGGIFVTSAGNSDGNACDESPAESDNAITVGSYDDNYIRSWFSNYGNCIDTWGPGSSIYSSTYKNTYSTYSGTSMSSPAIAAIIGLLLQKNPTLTFDNIKNILHCNAYGIRINDNLSPINYGFYAAIGDIDHIAKNPNECISPIITNNIEFDEIITNSIDISGETDYYRIIITSGTTDIYFHRINGINICLSFYNRNFNLLSSTQCIVNTLSITVGNGNYWLGISNSQSIGSYTIIMSDDDTTNNPSKIPTKYPSILPTYYTNNPSISPSKFPTKSPTINPSNLPTKYPSKYPSISPSKYPTISPTKSPNAMPTSETINPSKFPTTNPSVNPSKFPTISPTKNPSINPSKFPTTNPSVNPSVSPSNYPSVSPTKYPTKTPTDFTISPSKNPSISPSQLPSKYPSISPSKYPSKYPTKNPTKSPIVSAFIINCIGKDKCKSDRLQCPSDISCIINCQGETACADSSMYASKAIDVTINCIGKDVCKGNTNIDCGSGNCRLYCSEQTSCEDTRLDGSGSTSVECIGQCGKTTVANALINHRQHATNDHQTIISTNGKMKKNILIELCVGIILLLTFMIIIFVICIRKRQNKTYNNIHIKHMTLGNKCSEEQNDGGNTEEKIMINN